jgi:hypothetical protein
MILRLIHCGKGAIHALSIPLSIGLNLSELCG